MPGRRHISERVATRFVFLALVPIAGPTQPAAAQCRTVCMPDETRDANGCCAAPEQASSGMADLTIGCAAGQLRSPKSGGNCCWDGQVWVEGCRGVPKSCPDGFEPSGETCAAKPCTTGKERMNDGVSCCWPGQVAFEGQCKGVPNVCPAGTTRQGEACAKVPESKDAVSVHGQGDKFYFAVSKGGQKITENEFVRRYKAEVGNDPALATQHRRRWALVAGPVEIAVGAILVGTGFLHEPIRCSKSDVVTSEILDENEDCHEEGDIKSQSPAAIASWGIGGASAFVGAITTIWGASARDGSPTQHSLTIEQAKHYAKTLNEALRARHSRRAHTAGANVRLSFSHPSRGASVNLSFTF